MRLHITTLVVLMSLSTLVAAQVTSNVINRVFLIKGPTELGTAFTIEVDGRQYLITAKHVLKGMKEDDTIGVRKNDQWSPLSVKIFRCDDPVDIAVLIPPSQLSITFPLEASLGGVSLGGDTFFLGFPYAKTTEFKLSGGYPVPLIKRATLSGLSPLVPGKGALIVLDGYNNPGFSGSPVVFRDSTKSDVVFKVGGVVVSFLPEAGPVLKTTEVTQQQITSEDRQQSRILEYGQKLYKVTQETTDFVRLNTGVAFAHDIEFAVALIRMHAIGPKVAADFQPQ